METCFTLKRESAAACAAGHRLRLHPVAGPDAEPVHDRPGAGRPSWLTRGRTAGCTRRRSSTTRSPSEPPAELVEVRPGGTVTSWSWVTSAAGGPAAGASVRLGADPAGRRRHRDAARRRRRLGRRHAHRHAGPGPLGRGTPSGISATSPASSPARGRRRARWRAGPGHGTGHDDHYPGAAGVRAHRFSRGDRLPARAGGWAVARAALPVCRKVYLPPRGSVSRPAASPPLRRSRCPTPGS